MVAAKFAKWSKKGKTGISLEEWADLWEDWSRFAETGLSLDAALDIVRKHRKPPVARLVERWGESLREGKPLSALYASSGCYPLWLPLVRLGEETGDLAGMMALIAREARRLHLHRAQIRSQLAYPLAVTGLTAAVAVLFLAVVVPSLTAFYGTLGIGQEAVEFRGWSIGPGGWAVLAMVAITAALGMFRGMKRRGREPGLLRRGRMEAFTSEWAHGVGTLLEAGLSLDDALRHLSFCGGRVAAAARFVRDRMLAGRTLPEALEEWPLCSEELRAVTEMGLRLGRLDAVLLVLAERSRTRRMRRAERLVRWMEPALTLAAGLLALALFVLFYLPTIRIIGKVVP